MAFFHIHDTLALMGLAFAVGLIHMVAPDHGFPASLLAWRERWSSLGTLARVLGLVGLHALGGVALALAFQGLVIVARLDERNAWALAAGIVLASWIIRARRARRIFELVRAAPGRGGGWLTALSLLGPAEVLIPLGLRGAGIGSLVAFVAGSSLAGLAAVALSRRELRNPLGLIHAVERIRGLGAWAPLGLVAVAVAYLSSQ